MSNIKFSIIIPHYNTPNLLRRCLDTIPQRRDLEILIVDDNSSTEIVDFDKFPGCERSDTTIIYNKNKRGAGFARNIGIDSSRGKWILFADSDDFFLSHISYVFDKYSLDENCDKDIVYLNSQYFYEFDSSTKPTIFSSYIGRYLNKKFYSEKVLRYNMWTPWSRMVKRDLIINNDIRFEEIPVGNDKMFSLNCSKYATNISCEPLAVYNYFVPIKGSVTYSSSIKMENLCCKIDLIKRSNEFYDSVGYIFKSSLIYEYLINYKQNQEQERKSIYYSYFRRKDFYLFKDLWSMFLYLLGKLFKII